MTTFGYSMLKVNNQYPNILFIIRHIAGAGSRINESSSLNEPILDQPVIQLSVWYLSICCPGCYIIEAELYPFTFTVVTALQKHVHN